MDYTIILQNGNYALLDANTQYIVACGFDETRPIGQQWDHGLYFTHWNATNQEKQNVFCNALEAFREKTEPNYIPRCRLEELATQFKDGLLEDDEETALEYFDSVCEMTDEEKEWFGLKDDQSRNITEQEANAPARKKYELTGKTIDFDGRTLFQIKALISFGMVDAGDLGGWIEKEDNLSHDGNAWVYDNAKVYGYAKVYGDASVYGSAEVYGEAEVYGNASVYDNAKVGVEAKVYGNAQVADKATLSDAALVYDDARVCGVSYVGGNAKVYNNAIVFGNARVYDNACVCWSAQVAGKAEVYGSAQVYGNASVYGDAKVWWDANVCEKARIYGNAQVHDNAEVFGEAQVYGNAGVYGNAVVCDEAKVYGDAIVYDNAMVYDKAQVYGSAKVCECVCADSQVCSATGEPMVDSKSCNNVQKRRGR